jgi:hypothetical protein
MSNDFSNTPVPPPPPPPSAPMMAGPAAPRPFYQVWLDAVTKPSSQTYASMASSPSATASTAFIWIVLVSLLELIISALVSSATQKMMQQISGLPSFDRGGLGFGILSVVCGVPLVVLVFAALTGIVYLIARAFGGTGSYGQLAYVFAAIWSPLALVSSVLSLFTIIPLVGLCVLVISIALFIYMLVLMVIATGAVQRIAGGSAAVSVIAPYAVLCICAGVVAFVGLAALGPVIGNVFSSINNSLQTP